MNIVFKSGDYVSVPMTENLFWNRVGWLRHGIRPNKTDIPRVSLSFDIVFDRLAYSKR